jgi:hypothetical protein
MNKFLLILGFACACVLGFSVFHRQATRAHVLALVTTQQQLGIAGQLEQSSKRLDGFRAEVQEKKRRLAEALAQSGPSPELIRLLEGKQVRTPTAALAELRQQLGIGWESSPDYVLVNKSVLSRLDYSRLDSGKRPTDTASQLLGLSPTEQAALTAALQRARDGWQAPAVERTEPHGDIVAQYAVHAPDADAEMSLSNRLATDIVGAVGGERAELLLPSAWSEFRNGLGSTEAETLIVRRTADNGEADLVWETTRGNSNTSKGAVRYAYYPSRWFLTAFPGGWKTLAEREGFELPAKFRSPP